MLQSPPKLRSIHHLPRLLLSLGMLLLACPPAAAQSQAELARMERELKASSPKMVNVCFDVSGSMENLGVFGPLRETLIPLLRGGLKKGDRCVITAFDPEPKILFDRRITDESMIDEVVDSLPTDVTPERTGTNIRRAHHDGLAAAEKAGLPAGFIILVSDSYNDSPAKTDPAWPDYLKYYVPGPSGAADLAKYPPTAANRDYERLLKWSPRGNVETWGIGVAIDQRTRRPIERLPRTPEARAEEPPPPDAQAQPRREQPFPWHLIAIGLLALACLIGWVSANRPVHVSLSHGPKRHQNYSLRPRESVTIGGSGARDDPRGYALPGPLQPAAYLQRGFSDFTLRPGEAATAGEVALFLNNEEIRSPRRIEYADDIKVRIAAPASTDAPVEHRLQFGRAVEEEA